MVSERPEWPNQPDLPDNVTRYVSPDGQTILLAHEGYLLGDIHEVRPVYSYRLAKTNNRTLLNLAHFREHDTRHQWREDGTLDLFVGPVAIRVSVADGTWSFDKDGWRPHPLDGDLEAVEALLRAHLPEPRRFGPEEITPPSLMEKLKQCLSTVALVAIVLGAIWTWWTGNGSRSPSNDTRSASKSVAINAWLVECPGVSRLAVFSIEPDGSLSAPAIISRAKLLPVGDGRNHFAHDGLTVRIDDRDVIVERVGESLRCTPPDPAR